MQSVTARWVNPSVLTWARERLGLSPEDVERASGELGKSHTAIQAAQIREWEQETSEPDLEHLETLSAVYVCPVGYFFLPQPPQESLPLSFRGLAPGKEGRLSQLSHQTLRRFLELAEWAVFLIEDQGIPWRSQVQPIRQPTVEALVQQEKKRLGYTPAMRRKWREASEAFAWWRKTIEDLGIFCFQMKLGPDDIRGASMWWEGRYPFILVNHQDMEAAAGRIFTLLHEYAHLLTAEEGLVCDFLGRQHRHGTEPFANQFAARVLLSCHEVEERLKEIGKSGPRETWGDDVLDEIRQPFFVSRDAVAIALQDLRLAPGDFYQRKRAQWKNRKASGRGGKTLTKKERK
ncbi:MAG: ImmA/IrrE family metallo-endopeptidase, partial [Deltaproteobacteria bacterium]|nr:ImmA/IrrE family metallo-endopeptidase [Deltaproteobacteria bacterium]